MCVCVCLPTAVKCESGVAYGEGGQGSLFTVKWNRGALVCVHAAINRLQSYVPSFRSKPPLVSSTLPVCGHLYYGGRGKAAPIRTITHFCRFIYLSNSKLNDFIALRVLMTVMLVNLGSLCGQYAADHSRVSASTGDCGLFNGSYTKHYDLCIQTLQASCHGSDHRP